MDKYVYIPVGAAVVATSGGCVIVIADGCVVTVILERGAAGTNGGIVVDILNRGWAVITGCDGTAGFAITCPNPGN